jgi:Tfp pilus assembly protein PilV
MRFTVWSIVAVLVVAACSKQSPTPQSAAPPATPSQSEPFKPIATVKQVMQGITIPASNVVFAVAGTAPTDAVGWQAVEASALAIAESGNLLLMKPRAVDEQGWRQFSLALVDAGARAAEAARAHDAEKTSIAGDDMYNVCEQCHAKYMPKP